MDWKDILAGKREAINELRVRVAQDCPECGVVHDSIFKFDAEKDSELLELVKLLESGDKLPNAHWSVHHWDGLVMADVTEDFKRALEGYKLFNAITEAFIKVLKDG